MRTPEGNIRVRIAAPANEGKANKRLLAFLAGRLDVPPSYLTLTRGATGRHKTVEVEGLGEDEILKRLFI